MSTGKMNTVMAVIRAARPSFRNDHDKVAFAVHASFLASGCFPTATGPSAYADDALSSSSTKEVGIERWNDLEDEYAFVYVKPEGDTKKTIVKCLAMNDKLVVDAVKDGGREPVHTEINVGEFVGEADNSNYSAQYKNLEKLVKTLDEEILSKLDSPSSASTDPTPTSTGSESSRGSSLHDPWSPLMHRPGVVYPPVYPSGGSDLFPTPPAGAYPNRGGFGGDGGMLIGPNDPRWFGGGDIHPGFPGAPLGVPPGARFDPYGPPGVPGFEPNRFVRNPRRPGNGTHPDLEHFRDGSDFI